MIFPARVADPDLRLGINSPQEIRSELETARAAQSLYGDDSAVFQSVAAGAEQNILHCAVVWLQAVDRQVIARQWCFRDLLLGAANALEHGDPSVIIGVNADAEVHFLGIRVGMVCL